jgi:hypothetical protein
MEALPFEARESLHAGEVTLFLHDVGAFEKMMRSPPAKLRATAVQGKTGEPRERPYPYEMSPGKLARWPVTRCNAGGKFNTLEALVIAPERLRGRFEAAAGKDSKISRIDMRGDDVSVRFIGTIRDVHDAVVKAMAAGDFDLDVSKISLTGDDRLVGKTCSDIVRAYINNKKR